MAWSAIWSDFKIDCVWRLNRWNKLIFLHVDTDSFFAHWKIFWVGIVKNGCGQSGHGTLKLAVSSILFFYMLVQIQENKKLIHWFLGGPGQRSQWSFSSQCHIQICFGTIWTVWAPKKKKKKKPKKFLLILFLYIFHVKTKWNIYSLRILKSKNLFKRHEYPSPNALNIKYFWTFNYNHWGFFGITILTNP